MNIFSDKSLVYLIGLYKQHNGRVVSIDEFREDVKRIVYVSRILRKYSNFGTLNPRLLINHITILYNVFGNDITKILIDYVDSDIHPQLFGVLKFFSRLPKENIEQADPQIIFRIEKDISRRT